MIPPLCTIALIGNTSPSGQFLKTSPFLLAISSLFFSNPTHPPLIFNLSSNPINFQKVIIMKKEELAYKLTNDVFKHYKIKELEEKYNVSTGKLAVAIFNEIYDELKLPSDFEPVIFSGEDQIPD